MLNFSLDKKTYQGLLSRSPEPEQEPSNFGWLEPEPEPKTLWWWSRNRSLKFGFRFHIHNPSLWGKRVVQNTMVFTFQWTKLFWSRSQKLSDVGAGAGAKTSRCLELKPEIWAQLHSPGCFRKSLNELNASTGSGQKRQSDSKRVINRTYDTGYKNKLILLVSNDSSCASYTSINYGLAKSILEIYRQPLIKPFVVR